MLANGPPPCLARQGAGLPIKAINREAIKEWTAPFQLNLDQARQLATALGENRSVVRVTIDGCMLPVQQLRGHDPVESVDLEASRLSVASGLLLGRLLQRNSVLVRLELSKNGLTQNGRDFSAIDALAAAIKRHPSLRYLGLFDTTLCGVRYGQGQYNDQGLNVLAGALLKNDVLRSLNVLGNAVSRESLQALLREWGLPPKLWCAGG